MTEIFFENIVAKNKIETYISNIVIDEINKTEDENKRNTLLETFEKYINIKTLIADEGVMNEIAFLGENYIKENIIPQNNWNFQHLANINKEQRVLIVNKTLGYNYPFRMANPLEVYFEE